MSIRMVRVWLWQGSPGRHSPFESQPRSPFSVSIIITLPRRRCRQLISRHLYRPFLRIRSSRLARRAEIRMAMRRCSQNLPFTPQQMNSALQLWQTGMSANPIWIAGYFGPVAGASPVWIAPGDGTVPSAVQSQIVSYYAPVAGATAVWIAGFLRLLQRRLGRLRSPSAAGAVRAGRAAACHFCLVRRRRHRRRHDVEQRRADGDADGVWAKTRAIYGLQAIDTKFNSKTPGSCTSIRNQFRPDNLDIRGSAR